MSIIYNADDREKEELKPLIGAVIMSIDPMPWHRSKIEHVNIKLSDGRHVVMEVGGCDEYYIDWFEIQQPKEQP